MYFFQIFINNQWVDSISGKTFDTINPHNGAVTAKIAEGDKVNNTNKQNLYKIIELTFLAH